MFLYDCFRNIKIRGNGFLIVWENCISKLHRLNDTQQTSAARGINQFGRLLCEAFWFCSLPHPHPRIAARHEIQRSALGIVAGNFRHAAHLSHKVASINDVSRTREGVGHVRRTERVVRAACRQSINLVKDTGACILKATKYNACFWENDGVLPFEDACHEVYFICTSLFVIYGGNYFKYEMVISDRV